MKDIFKFKIAISSDCTLRCKHCFINKDAGIILPFEAAVKAIDFFLESPGNVKKLELYGGEPFIHFDLLKDIILYSRKKSKIMKKKLTIDIASNATLLRNEFLEFLKGENIRLSISVFGTEESHNMLRQFIDGRGSYHIVIENSKKILRNLGYFSVTAIICVHPYRAGYLFNDFLELYKLGFRIFNIECVSGIPWDNSSYDLFYENIIKIRDFIFSKIKEKNFFVLFETFIPFIDKNYQDILCPFYKDLEMYPTGDFSFYPYAFIKDAHKMKKIIVGNFREGLNKKFLDCKFSLKNKICSNCIRSYYTLKGYEDGSYAYSLRTRGLSDIIIEIIKASKKDKNYLSYLRKIISVVKQEY